MTGQYSVDRAGAASRLVVAACTCSLSTSEAGGESCQPVGQPVMLSG